MAAALLGPAVLGVVAWAATGQWRWSVFGLIVGAVVVAVILAVVVFLDTDAPDVGPGFVLGMLVVIALVPLGALALWLWTGSPYWALGLLSPLLALIVVGVSADT